MFSETFVKLHIQIWEWLEFMEIRLHFYYLFFFLLKLSMIIFFSLFSNFVFWYLSLKNFLNLEWPKILWILSVNTDSYVSSLLYGFQTIFSLNFSNLLNLSWFSNLVTIHILCSTNFPVLQTISSLSKLTIMFWVVSMIL